MKTFYLQPKLITALRGYNGRQLMNDVIAGIIVAIIALPLSIALALASGVNPECGVYTAIAAGFVVSLLGGSRVQIAGPTAAFATIVAGVVATQGMDGLFLATVIAGLLLIVMGVCKLGSLIKYMPHTITVGFTSGIAVTILLGQVKDFVGITYADGVKPVEMMEKMEANIAHIDTASLWALLIGAISLAVQYYAVPKVCFNVSPGSFFPPPKVTSSVIRLDIKKENDIQPENEKNMFRLIRAAFNQRRKTFVNSVSSTLSMPKADIEAALAEIGENPMVRPEKLSLKQFSLLSDILMK